MSGEILLIGLGQPLCGDDEIGLRVARELQGTPGMRVEFGEGALWRLGAEPRLPGSLILVDAVRCQDADQLGRRLHLRFPMQRHEILAARPRNTHSLELLTLLDALAAIGSLPPTHIYGVFGWNFEPGLPPHRRVLAGGQRLAARMRRLLARRQALRSLAHA